MEPHDGVAGLLSDPSVIRVVGWRTEVNATTAKVNEDQDEGGPLAQRGENVLGEEIRAHDAFHMGSDKGEPWQWWFLLFLLGSRMDPSLDEDAFDRVGSGVEAEFLEFPGNAAIPPQNVLLGHANGGAPQFLGQTWAAKRFERLTFVGLIGPSPIGGRLDDFHQIGDVVATGRAEADQFRRLLRRWCDPLCWHSILEDADLGFKQPGLGVVSGAENLGHHDQQEGK